MKYVIFGPGRVGANVGRYLEMLGHDVALISRAAAENGRTSVSAAIERADVIAAAVPDSTIQPWYCTWRSIIGDKTAVHFSGALMVNGMISFHPLYSFPNGRLTADQLKSIAFAQTGEGPSFSDVFPGAQNPTFVIPPQERARYHALAVLSGNFAAYLWNETAKEFASRYDSAPAEILTAYFSSVVDRFTENPENSLTGPVARRDLESVEANLNSLNDTPRLQALYKSFLTSAWPEHDRETD